MVYGGIAIGLFSALAVTTAASTAYAFSLYTAQAQADTLAGSSGSSDLNSQQMPLATGAIGPGTLSGTDSAASDILVSGAALTANVGPAGTVADANTATTPSSDISFYTVHAGDSLSGIASMYGVSKNTIESANGLDAKSSLKAGTVLTILPVSGIEHTVKKGETVKSIAKTFGADESDISFYNNLDADEDLSVGDTILIPDSDASTSVSATGDSGVSTDTPDTPTKSTTKSSTTKTTTKDTTPAKSATKTPTKPAITPSAPVNTDGLATTNKNGSNSTPITVHPVKDYDKPDLGDAILRPVPLSSSHRSQGAHGFDNSAVDLAAPLGTPISAAADGTVLLARTGGYNDGYGNYVIIMSEIDGHQVETIYAHMSKVIAVAGQSVSRGDEIGLVGMTGDATGDHVHFEVRGALNPLTVNANYTGN